MPPEAFFNLSLPWDSVGNLIKGTTVSLLADADEAAGDRWPCCTSGGRDFTHLSWELTSQICALSVTNRIKSCYWSKQARTFPFLLSSFSQRLSCVKQFLTVCTSFTGLTRFEYFFIFLKCILFSFCLKCVLERLAEQIISESKGLPTHYRRL